MRGTSTLDEQAVGALQTQAARRPRLKQVSWPTIALFLLPALLLYVLFVIYPVLQSVRFSFWDWNGLTAPTPVGLDNFARAFADPDFVEAMTHNGIIIVLSLLLQLPVALGLAVLLNQKLKFRGLLRAMFFAPYILSEVVTGVVWRQIYRPGGLLDQILIGIGAEGAVQEWLANPDIVLYSLFFVISWQYFGFHMVLMLAGLQQIPDELKEAAAIDGGSSRQIFRHVTLPLLAPTIRVSMFLSIVGALQLFDLVWVVTQGGPIGASSTMATFLYDQFLKNLWGYASAVSIIIFLLSAIFAFFYQRTALRRDLDGMGYV
jgi:raffinose/stachyose/melibiose transport system permease protein